MAIAIVEHQSLGQGAADAPDHPAIALRCRCFLVQNPACAKYAQHPPDPGFPGHRIDRHFGKIGPVGRLLHLFERLAGFNMTDCGKRLAGKNIR